MSDMTRRSASIHRPVDQRRLGAWWWSSRLPCSSADARLGVAHIGRLVAATARIGLAALILVTYATATLVIASPQVRDASARASGSARILGRVVGADTGRPLRRARLILAGSSLDQSRVVHTDV